MHVDYADEGLELVFGTSDWRDTALKVLTWKMHDDTSKKLLEH
jgi:hypothetical protein